MTSRNSFPLKSPENTFFRCVTVYGQSGGIEWCSVTSSVCNSPAPSDTCLSVRPSVRPSICPSVCLSICLSHSIPFSPTLSHFLSLSLTFSLSISDSLSLSLTLSDSLYDCYFSQSDITDVKSPNGLEYSAESESSTGLCQWKYPLFSGNIPFLVEISPF